MEYQLRSCFLLMPHLEPCRNFDKFVELVPKSLSLLQNSSCSGNVEALHELSRNSKHMLSVTFSGLGGTALLLNSGTESSRSRFLCSLTAA